MKKESVLKDAFVTGYGNLESVSDSVIRIRFAAILFCVRGEAILRINLKTYRITPDSQVILLPDSLIKAESFSENTCIRHICFTEDMLHEICRRFEPAFFHFMLENPVYSYKNKKKDNITALFYAIRSVSEDRNNTFRVQIALNILRAFMLDILDKVRHYCMKEEIPENSRHINIFNNFITLVHKGCKKERSVAYYADKLCITAKYLTDICNSITGTTAKELIDDFAIQEIKLLIQSTDLNMNEIAARLSFPDQSYLGRFFKRHTEMSPKEYRKIYTNAENITSPSDIMVD